MMRNLWIPAFAGMTRGAGMTTYEFKRFYSLLWEIYCRACFIKKEGISGKSAMRCKPLNPLPLGARA